MKPNILIVNWGTQSASYILQQTLTLNPCNLYLASSNKITDDIQKIFPPDHIVYTNPYDITSLYKDVCIFSKKNHISFPVVTTFFEMSVYEASQLAELLHCQFYLPSKNALTSSVNKYFMRETLASYKLIQPKYYPFSKTTIKEAYNFYKHIHKPAIVKPIHSGHSYGTRMIPINQSYENFQKIFYEALNDLDNSYDEWMDHCTKEQKQHYLIEEFIDGKMVSCDGFVKKNKEIKILGTTEFILSDPPLMHQIGHTVPIATLTQKQIQSCLTYAKKIVSLLQLQYCGFHCELKFYDNQPYLIEIGARLPGAILLESYQNTSAYNVIDYFFSLFEEKKREIIKNKSYNKSELLYNKYCYSTKELKISSFINLNKKNPDISIRTAPLNKILFNHVRFIWIYSVKITSKTLSAKNLTKNLQPIITNIKIKYTDTIYIRLISKIKLYQYAIKLFLCKIYKL